MDRALAPNGCLDIDECFERSHNCHSYAACHNQRGAFYCECNTGFEGSGVNCEDIDECSKAYSLAAASGTFAQPYICDHNQHCKNTIGSYYCACNSDRERDNGQCHDKEWGPFRFY